MTLRTPQIGLFLSMLSMAAACGTSSPGPTKDAGEDAEAANDASADASPDGEVEREWPPTGDGVEIRLLHAAPSAGDLDVYFTYEEEEPLAGDEPAIENLSLGSVWSLSNLKVGTYVVWLYDAAEQPGVHAPLHTFGGPVAADQLFQSALVPDNIVRLNDIDDDGEAPDVAFLLPVDPPADAADTSLRLLNAVPDWNSVDLYAVDAGDDVLLAENLAKGGAEAVDVSAGTVRIGVDINNTDDEDYEAEFVVPATAGARLHAVVTKADDGLRLVVYADGSKTAATVLSPE